jgi:transglutaminase-like putative cysteine protease
MKLHIEHTTQYDYSLPLQYAHQALCLTPQASAHQTVHDWSLAAPGPLFPEIDGWGNQAHTWSLMQRTYSGRIRATGVVETHASPYLSDAHASPWLYLRHTALTEPCDALRALGHELLSERVDECHLLALAREVRRRVAYEEGSTRVSTTAQQALQLGSGVCQDHAHVFIAACRSQRVPARYVSGYFFAPGAPHLASHAWVDVCIDVSEGLWVSIDVTHACLMDERHVRLAVGPDYAACSPIRGVREGGGDESMKVRISINEAPTAIACQPAH